MACGVYFYRIEAGNNVAMRKMMLVKNPYDSNPIHTQYRNNCG